MGSTGPSVGTDVVTILREDYQLKASYLTEHFNRVWTRFNFLLGVQVALFGAVAYFLFDKDARDVDATLLPIGLGLATALLWFFIGVQDRYLVEEYREGLKAAFQRLRKHGGMEHQWFEDDYVGHHGGQTEKGFDWRGWLSWYVEPISITHLPALIPLLAAALWVGALVLQRTALLWFSPRA